MDADAELLPQRRPPTHNCRIPRFGPLEDREAAEETAAALGDYLVVPYRARDIQTCPR
jgi:hypothetical protein